MISSVVISSGHGLGVPGAVGYVSEVEEARKITERSADYMRSMGVTVTTFHDNTSDDQSENLHEIVDFHNAQPAHDLDVSVHLNAYQTTTKPMGSEVCYKTDEALADKVSAAMASALGLPDRGGKERNDLYFLNTTKAKAVLLECFFVDSTVDTTQYHARFEQLCAAIAESLTGLKIENPPPPSTEQPPTEAGPPSSIEDAVETPLAERPVLSDGDEGDDVFDLQYLLNATELSPGLDVDGDFGKATESAVTEYQATRGLAADGICGPITWQALYESTPALPPPPHALSAKEIDDIGEIAMASDIAVYAWKNRGVAPPGYVQGMALAFAQSYRKLKQGHPAAVDMAKARKSSDKDALHVYWEEFNALDMSNEIAGTDTLRHLYALMLGHGMRESSGRHCEGRDLSASNVQSDTAEAGLFQTSYNAHSASDPEFDNLMTEYSSPANAATCYLAVFAEGVSCTNDEWGCYGSGEGYAFQELCKDCPAFAVETCGLTLRNLANHYGPIIRHETELKAGADDMFRQVQDYIDQGEAVA